MTTAKLIGVGVGPGDPELLTLAAINRVEEAKCLAYVVNQDGKSFARAIVAKYIPKNTIELPLLFSMSPDIETRIKSRAQAGEKVLTFIEKGIDVCFITEGDPLLYSTFQHLMAAVPDSVETEIVPGITAYQCAASRSAFSLALENETVVISSALNDLNHLAAWLKTGKSVVLYKVFKSIAKIKKILSGVEPSPKAILIENAGTADEMIDLDWKNWTEENLPYFSIILISPPEHEK